MPKQGRYQPEDLRPNGPVVAPGEFVFAAAFLEHDHLFGQCAGLIAAGGTLKWVFDAEPAKLARLQTRFPDARAARHFDEILADPAVQLVTAAAIPSERCSIGCQVMRAGKDYFTDKAPLTTPEQLSEARRTVDQTRRKYAVYFSERFHNEAVLHATAIVAGGVIGKVVQVISLGPHRLGPAERADWFFDDRLSGGILCDLGCHHFDQFLTWTGATDVAVTHAAVANHTRPDRPRFKDYGEASLRADTGATHVVRVDWLAPDGLGTWGDGRNVILGTNGYIELRKQTDIARDRSGSHVYVVDAHGEHHIPVEGQINCRLFGDLILDCLQRTETAMTQEHVFRVAEIAIRAQAMARRTRAQHPKPPEGRIAATSATQQPGTRVVP